MNNIPSQTTNEYDNISGSNPSLITAGIPSGSIMTPHLFHSFSKTKQHYHINQNRATNQEKTNSQYTINSNRTKSDTYLNLSRKDIDDVMLALQTLAQCVKHDRAMLYSKSTNHTLKSLTSSISSSHYYSNHCLHQHHTKHHRHLDDNFQYELHKKDCRILHQLKKHKKYFNQHNPSYSSNAMLYTSSCRSNKRAKHIHHYSPRHQSKVNIPSENQYQQSIKFNLSPYILDKLIYVDHKRPMPNIQILPQQAHTLEILQNTDMSGIGDQLISNKIDVATQWSLQMVSSSNSKNVDEKQILKSTHSVILTELSPSITTIETEKSIKEISSMTKIQQFEKKSSLTNNQSDLKTNNNRNEICLEKSFLSMNNENELTKSDEKQTFIDDGITRISLDNDSLPSLSLLNKKKTKTKSIKFASKRLRHPASKSSKNNQTIKRSRTHRRSQSNNQSIRIIQSYKTTNPKDDSFFDFFDIDKTLSDAYDRLFTDTTTS